MNLLENVSVKLDEADFYLALMIAIEEGRHALTKSRPAKTEFSYLLSAFLNACYSAIQYVGQHKSHKDYSRKFLHDWPKFYKSGSNGGWRTLSVHFRPVQPEHRGYMPPGSGKLVFKRKIDSKNSGGLIFEPGSFYFSKEGAQHSICEQCVKHLTSLREFVESCSQMDLT